MNKEIKFPDRFLFGTATAALQIEGGDKNNNWYDWSEQGRIEDGSHSVLACDHWNRWEKDVELIAAINNQTYRLGIEWSRIMPEKGMINQEALAIYRKELELLLSKDIKPLVTLWHFSNPMWIERNGGWLNKETVDHYLDFVKLIVEEFGDLVSDWITLNEPNVYLTMAYFEGKWPPGQKGQLGAYIKGAKNFISAHLQAYQLIHNLQANKTVQNIVGVAHHLRIFKPLKNTWVERKVIGVLKNLFQGIFLEGMTKGKLAFPLIGKSIAGVHVDFIGINYYSRDIIKASFSPSTLFGERLVQKGSAVNDLGWEIYPEGIYEISKEVYERYKLPIFITENGTCDKNDKFRKDYIKTHLTELAKAIEECTYSNANKLARK